MPQSNRGVEWKKITGLYEAVQYIVAELARQLTERDVLIFLPGGSVIPVAVEAVNTLSKLFPKRLHVTLTDERYGPYAHADSNWQQLLQAGMQLDEVYAYPILKSLNKEETHVAYERLLEDLFARNTYRFGLFGMGTDGHIAGILPDSQAVKETGDLTVAYSASPYERITMTFKAIRNLNEGAVVAMGQAKYAALNMLRTDQTLTRQPAQIIKTVPQATIYNDVIGD